MNNEELDLLSDSKYRQFISAVDKALKSFEYSSEWADLISALGKLNKALQGHPKFKAIPRKLTIGKRLSQCTHPALPSGVHLKALETYDLIFKRLGKKGLGQDLFIYGAGLFPLLGNAAMSVKPVLMGLYEEHFLSLGKALLPGLQGLLLGLLPGIEEGSEYTERTISLLEAISHNTDRPAFYTCLWSCFLSSSSVRLPAVTFILSRLSRKTSLNKDYILGDDIPLMIESVCTSLADSSVLVQRSLLEFLLTFLPMDTTLIDSKDKVKLVASGLGVLLRRDMSLNRRLYSWLLGPDADRDSGLSRGDNMCSGDEQEDSKFSFFSIHSKHHTIEALKSLFRDHGGGSANTSNGAKRSNALRPFRILISLLDRPEVGSAILEDVLIEVFRALYVQCKVIKEKTPIEELGSYESIESLTAEFENPSSSSSKTKLTDEVVKTANLLFNAFEPYFMWDYLSKLLSDCEVSEEQETEADSTLCETEGKCSRLASSLPTTTCSEIFRLTDFLLDIVALEADVETQTEHWPELLRRITMEMTSRCEMMSLSEVREGICLCSKLLSKVMPSMKTIDSSRPPSRPTSVASDKESIVGRDMGESADAEAIESERVRGDARVIQVARITQGEEDLRGWSVVDLRKRLENYGNADDDGTCNVKDGKSRDETHDGSCDESDVSHDGSRNMSRDSLSELDRSRDSIDGERIENGTSNCEMAERENADEILDKTRIKKLGDSKPGSSDIDDYSKLKKSKQSLADADDNDGGPNDNDGDDNDDDDDDNYGDWNEFQESDKPQYTLEQFTELGNDDTFINEPCAEDQVIPDSQRHVFQPSLIQSCVAYFQAFYAEFVEQRVLRYANVLTSPTKSRKDQVIDTDYMLDEILYGEDFLLKRRTSTTHERSSTHTGPISKCDRVGPILDQLLDGVESPILDQHGCILCAEAFAAACKLLVELSCFPVYCTHERKFLDTDKKEDRLPEWLRALVLCCYQVGNFDIQSSAISTLLDLINLTLSVTPTRRDESPSATVAVVVIPMISHEHLNVIEHSAVYQIIAESLWARLRPAATRHQQRIVELFLQLHSLTPMPSLCTNIIGSSLSENAKEACLVGHWKFAVFWHISRNVVVQDSGRTSRLGDVRPLDRALFLMLDGLESSEPEIRVVTKQWLTHALQQGDLGRLVDPLLLLLLHPATARVSVHHACATDSKKIRQGNASEDDPTPEDDRRNSSETQDSTSKNRRESDSAISGLETSEASEVTHPEANENDDEETGVENENEEKRRLATIKYLRGISTKTYVEKNPEKKAPPPSDHAPKPQVHPLDQHKLVYVLRYDWKLTLYAFNTILSVLRSAPHQFVCAASAHSVSSSNTPHQVKMKELLARHRKCLLGKGFYGPLYDSPTASAPGQSPTRQNVGPLLYLRPNTSKYLEILISVCLYFIRSEYGVGLDRDAADVDGNAQVQMTSAEVLTSIVWQLVEVVRETGAGFGPFISDLFTRCKVQKALLHCLVSTLYERTGINVPTAGADNGPHLKRIDGGKTASQLRGLQVKLLKLLQAIFVLESNIELSESITNDSITNVPASPAKLESESTIHQSAQRYIPGRTLARQSMLLSAVLHGLKYDDYDLHHEWLQFVITCLPHMKGSLSTWVVRVTEQVGRMLEFQTTAYQPLWKHGKTGKDQIQSMPSLPPDYIASLLEHIGTICHFCLLDGAPSSPGLSLLPRTTPFPSTTSAAQSDTSQSGSSSSQIFSNLLHAFSVQSAPSSLVASVDGPKPLLGAREGLLSILPSLLSAVFTVWNAWSPQTFETTGQRLPSESYLYLIGTPKMVRHHVMQLLTPVAMHHTIVFLASLADVWHQRRRGDSQVQTANKTSKVVVPQISEEQVVVVDIVYGLKALSFDNTIDNIKQIVRQVVTNKDKSTVTHTGLEVNILQFFYYYMQRATQSQLTNSRGSLISLMKEGLQLNQPPALFLMLVILQSYVQRLPLQEDKKARKELQDITQRLIEACNTVAGSSLEKAAWLSRSLAVIPQIESSPDQSSAVESEFSELSESEPSVQPLVAGASSGSHYSTQALTVLSEVLASLLDMVFGSEEKDRVTTILTSVMYNVTPYMKNHGPRNVPNFRACCALVSALSGYQYMRRAWRKEVMEQVLDPVFFQMDITCIASWRTIIDNLMTQDRTSFKDLMAKVAGFGQSAAINIFANKEQEIEQRASLLKKLAFAIFCSETDQYQDCLPEIQERLAESLRLAQVPVLHEQVFLALRVLLLRMSPQHLTSLWPVMVSEVVHVLLQMESDLSSEGKSTSSQRLMTSEALFGNNVVHNVTYSQDKWLGLYLAACKLLDLALCLSSEALPHFQMYRWAFEGGDSNATMVTRSSNGDSKAEKISVFKPHIARLWKLLRKRSRRTADDIDNLLRAPDRPLLTMYQIKSMDQLLPFFRCLVKAKFGGLVVACGDKPKKKTNQGRFLIERVVERDFLEPLVME
ncbi:protein dopey-1 isoform X2 [Nematostella vectensis]|uniref:protein dopey-1 isoform X2 n=1 Tax=Nematostella vectensis TaxID=45351 RepID=UPI002076F7A0|nr:protein dopey-1 isoform X2 [Nematostella vectensis]